MPAPTSEAGLQGRIVRAILKLHPQAFIFHPVGSPFQTAGIPDLLVCIEGLFVGIEVKWARPGESHQHALSRATPQQRQQIQLIMRAGGMAGVVASVDEALDLCRRAFEKQRREH